MFAFFARPRAAVTTCGRCPCFQYPRSPRPGHARRRPSDVCIGDAQKRAQLTKRETILSIVIRRTHRTVSEAGHARLYHYEKFCSEWLSTTLREQRIHCSDPKNLNDPWDCRPFFDTRSLQDAGNSREFMSWFHAQAVPPAVA